MTPPVFIDCSIHRSRSLTPEQLAPVPDLVIHVGDPSAAELPGIVGGAERILVGHTMMPEPVLRSLPSVKRIVFLGTGASSYIDVDAAEALGIEVRTVAGYGDRSVAEHTIALLFAAARNIARHDAEMRGGRWAPAPGVTLHGATLGVVGAGGIGREVIRMAAALGMHVLATARRPPDQPLPCEFVPLPMLLARSDAVSLHLALNGETRGMIGAPELASMKPTAFLINTARAALVDSTLW